MKVPDIKGLMSIARGALDPKKGQAPAAQPGAKPGADKIELSGDSQTLQRITAERMDAKARAAQVAALKAAHARGELKTDSKATAEAMVEEGLFDDLIHGT